MATLPTSTATPDSERSASGLLLAAIGSGLLLGGRPARQSAARSIATVAGLALLGVAAHAPLSRALRKAGTKRRAGSIRFSFVVDQPVEAVFSFCADFENFPRLISSLRQVRDNGDGRSHWCASTPAGGTVEWDAVTTKFVTNSVIGWRSVPRSDVQMTGLLRFTPEDGKTCVQVSMDYRVTKGHLADSLAALARPRRVKQIEHEIREYFASA